MSWYRRAFGAHYPLLYAHRDEAEARSCIRTLVARVPLREGPVLDLGCGDGRHLRRLAERGLTAVGLDLSAPLLEAARTRGSAGGTHLVRGDMRRLPLATGSTAAVLSLFTAFGYFGDLADHAPLVAGIARVLRPGGHWVLDYLNCRRVWREVERQPRRETTRRLGALEVREVRTAGRGALSAGRTVVKSVELSAVAGHEAEADALGVPAAGLDYREEVALFELPELDRVAAAAGLRRRLSLGDYTGAELVEDGSPRWLLVYEREG